MKIIRVAQGSDLGEMVKMFLVADDRLRGLTSLSSDHAFNEGRLDETRAALEVTEGEPGRFLFVLADSQSGELFGTSGIGVPGHHKMPSQHLEAAHDFAPPDSAITHIAPALSLVNVADGCGEFQSLFLKAAARGGGMGTLLSRSRMLFIADHGERFPKEFVSELRGVCDADGTFPFWEGFARHYTGLSSSEAETIVASEGNGPLAELLPQEPVPLSLIGEAARNAIGGVHTATQGALKLLGVEGFANRQLVNILDGGPMPMVRIADATSVANSSVLVADVVDVVESPQSALVSNRRWEDFRVILGAVEVGQPGLRIDRETASALQIEDGDEVRHLNLEATK